MITVGKIGITVFKGGTMKKRIIVFGICALLSIAIFTVSFALLRNERRFCDGTIIAAEQAPSSGNPSDYTAEQNLRYAAYKLNGSDWTSTYSSETSGIVQTKESGNRYKKNRSVLWIKAADAPFATEDALYFSGERVIARSGNEYKRIAKSQYEQKYGFVPYELSMFIINSDTKKTAIKESYDKQNGVYVFSYKLKPEAAVYADKILCYETGIDNVKRLFTSVSVKMDSHWNIIEAVTTEKYSVDILGGITVSKTSTEKFSFGCESIPDENKYKSAQDYADLSRSAVYGLLKTLCGSKDIIFSLPLSDACVDVNILPSVNEIRIRYNKNEIRTTDKATYIYSRNVAKIALPLSAASLINGNDKLKLLGEICMIVTKTDISDVIKSLTSVLSNFTSAITYSAYAAIQAPSFNLAPDYEMVNRVLRSIKKTENGVNFAFLLDNENTEISLSISDTEIIGGTINGVTLSKGSSIQKAENGTDITKLLADTVISLTKKQCVSVNLNKYDLGGTPISGNIKVTNDVSKANADVNLMYDGEQYNIKMLYDENCSVSVNNKQKFTITKTNFLDTIAKIADILDIKSEYIDNIRQGEKLSCPILRNASNSSANIPQKSFSASDAIAALLTCEFSTSDDGKILNLYYGEKTYSLSSENGNPSVSGKGFRANFEEYSLVNIQAEQQFDANFLPYFVDTLVGTINKGNCQYKGSVKLQIKTELIDYTVSDINFVVKADYKSGNMYAKIEVPSSVITTKANSYIFLIGDTVYLKSDRYGASIGAVSVYKETLYKNTDKKQFLQNVTDNLMFLIPVRETVTTIIAANIVKPDVPDKVKLDELLSDLYCDDNSLVLTAKLDSIVGVEQSSLALELVENDGYFYKVNAGIKISLIELALNANSESFTDKIELGKDSGAKSATLIDMAALVPSAFKSYPKA